jgi:hypothetical protein
MATLRFLSRYMLGKGKGNLTTHTLLDGWRGGKVLLNYNDPSVLPEFLCAVAQDIKNGEKLFINERRACIFRMFLDLDFYIENVLTDINIEHMTRIIYECFKRFLPVTDAETNRHLCIISDADPKCICTDVDSLYALIGNKDELDKYTAFEVTEEEKKNAIFVDEDKSTFVQNLHEFKYDTVFNLVDGKFFKNTHRNESGLLKHGVHIVFPHIIVEQSDALFMREALLEALTLEFGLTFAPKGWQEVVDNAVYGNSGLRMIYSCKTKVCEHCKGKDNGKDCKNVCVNGKDLSNGRPYKFRFACLNGAYNDDITETLKNNLLLLLNHAIIYTPLNYKTKDLEKFECCPSYGNFEESTRKNGPPKMKSKSRVFKEEKQSMRSWSKMTLVSDDRIKEIIQHHIQTRFAAQYGKTRVQTIKKNDKAYFVSVEGEGSNFCLNLNPPRDHNSNRIWFCVERSGIQIRCFCTCMTTEKRYTGMCKYFKTPFKPINDKELKILFPDISKPVNSMFMSTSTFFESLRKDMRDTKKPRLQN